MKRERNYEREGNELSTVLFNEYIIIKGVGEIKSRIAPQGPTRSPHRAKSAVENPEDEEEREGRMRGRRGFC